MQLTYDDLSDAIYVRLRRESVTRTERASHQTAIDFGPDGGIVGIELLEASQGIDANQLWLNSHRPFREVLEFIGRHTAFPVTLPRHYWDSPLRDPSAPPDPRWALDESGTFRWKGEPAEFELPRRPWEMPDSGTSEEAGTPIEERKSDAPPRRRPRSRGRTSD